jgi:hypothetical protein
MGTDDRISATDERLINVVSFSSWTCLSGSLSISSQLHSPATSMTAANNLLKFITHQFSTDPNRSVIFTDAKFQRIIRVKNFYAVNCKNMPCRYLQGMIYLENLLKRLAKMPYVFINESIIS